jgi:thiamine pyrophosphokinase
MAVFVVGGSPVALRPVDYAPGAGDRVIAADKGAEHARAWGWPIHLLVGDLDSLAPAVAAAVMEGGTPVIRVPAAKDETDLELALQQALEDRTQPVVICAALGGRTDHLLANVLLLARSDLAGRDVVLADGPETVRLLAASGAPRGLELTGAAGDLLSLLPLGGDAVGIKTAGLLYPLHDETLFLGQARGISNVFASELARVTLREGNLLVVHITSQAGGA